MPSKGNPFRNLPSNSYLGKKGTKLDRLILAFKTFKLDLEGWFWNKRYYKITGVVH